MKDIRPGLFASLTADAAIAAVVSEGNIRHVYPTRLPQGVKKPALVYTRISGQGDYTMAGPSGYARPRYQIDAWAPTADAATSLANLVKDAIDGFSGAMGSGTNAVFVQGAFIADEREDYDDTVQMYRSGRDYFIHYGEL